MGLKTEVEMIKNHIRVYDCNTINIPLWYPRSSEIKKFEIELMDVRAADSIQVEYDFDRDGWKISQASTFEWSGDDTVECDSDWQEVAFIKAWGRKKHNG